MRDLKKNLSFVLLLLSGLTISGCNAASSEYSALKAGQVVSESQASELAVLDNFKPTRIPEPVWSFMQNRTYKENPYIGRDDLSYLKVLHYDSHGMIHVGEIVCNKRIAGHLAEIFFELYQNKYPIEKIMLPDYFDADDEKQMRANNTSSFCYRTVAGSTVLSHHSRGMAIDINTLYNPFCKIKSDGKLFVQPATAAEYCNRSGNFSQKIDEQDLAYKLFTKHGFTWGGHWQSLKDYQHFEYDDAK